MGLKRLEIRASERFRGIHGAVRNGLTALIFCIGNWEGYSFFVRRFSFRSGVQSVSEFKAFRGYRAETIRMSIRTQWKIGSHRYIT